ncbi:hypothetical protein FPV67DRAFT_1449073 [Lyophyllum atratum]|nr:hypothetical protein FPV67DRAFT_1449073 [Lyophyllum atratum]
MYGRNDVAQARRELTSAFGMLEEAPTGEDWRGAGLSVRINGRHLLEEEEVERSGGAISKTPQAVKQAKVLAGCSVVNSCGWVEEQSVRRYAYICPEDFGRPCPPMQLLHPISILASSLPPHHIPPKYDDPAATPTASKRPLEIQQLGKKPRRRLGRSVRKTAGVAIHYNPRHCFAPHPPTSRRIHNIVRLNGQWRSSNWGRSPGDDSGAACPQDSCLSKRTVVPTYTLTAFERQWASPSTTTPATVSRHIHRQVAGYIASSGSLGLSVEYTSQGNQGSSPPGSVARTAQRSFASSAWIYTQKHRHCTQDRCQETRWRRRTSSSVAPRRPPNPNPRRLAFTTKKTLDPRITTDSTPQLPPKRTPCRLAYRVLARWARARPSQQSRRIGPRTVKRLQLSRASLGRLTFMIDSTGRSICNWRTSTTRPLVVTVEDVADALNGALMDTDEDIGVVRQKSIAEKAYTGLRRGTGLAIEEIRDSERVDWLSTNLDKVPSQNPIPRSRQ